MSLPETGREDAIEMFFLNIAGEVTSSAAQLSDVEVHFDGKRELGF